MNTFDWLLLFSLFSCSMDRLLNWWLFDRLESNEDLIKLSEGSDLLVDILRWGILFDWIWLKGGPWLLLLLVLVVVSEPFEWLRTCCFSSLVRKPKFDVGIFASRLATDWCWILVNSSSIEPPDSLWLDIPDSKVKWFNLEKLRKKSNFTLQPLNKNWRKRLYPQITLIK